MKAKIAVSVYGASKSAVAAVEKAGGTVEILAPKRATAEAAAREHVNSAVQAAKDAGVAAVSGDAVAGDPADVLLSEAEKRGVDLIVVGSKGMQSSTRFILGSVPNNVSHHAPCDLLIVRTTK